MLDIQSGLGSGLGLGSSKKKKSDGDMGAVDWMGMGLQIAGAMANQKEEDQALELEAKRHTESLGLGARNRADQLQQNAIENRQQDRNQNQAGLNYMTGLVDSNAAAAKKRVPSFRQAMLYGGF
jgi:hypothetical protein